MTHLAWVFSIIAVVLAIAAYGCAGRATAVRSVVVPCCLVALYIVLYGAGVDLLGRPRPVSVIPFALGQVIVLSHSFDEGRAIYLWVTTADADVPLALALPWDERAAIALERAAQAAQQDGLPLMARPSSGYSDGSDGIPMFWPAPQPANPEKHPAP